MSEFPALAGRRIVVTRQAEQAESLCRRLEQQGAVALRFPTIALEPLPAPELDRALAVWDEYAWLVLTSANAVRFFQARLLEAGGALPQPDGRGPRVAVTGSTTAAALEAVGVGVDFIPPTFSGAALASSLPNVQGRRILIPRAEQGRPELTAGLAARGALVDDIAIYATVPAAPAPEQYTALAAGVDALTFTSPLTVQNFVELTRGMALDGAVVACIGPTTAEAARALGFEVDVVPSVYTTHGLIAALGEFYTDTVTS